MQVALAALLAAGTLLPAQAAASPIGKVLSMLSDLQAKISGEGEAAQKEYAEFVEWCEDRSRNLGFEIQTGKADVERLEAAVAKETASLSASNIKVDELAADIASKDNDLQAATAIRKQEAATFATEELELVETIDVLGRATGILERQMGGSSMVQLNTADNLAQAFKAMVQASLIGTGDAAVLTSFAQSADKDDDELRGAPAASAYESQSGDIVDTLQGLTEKAESQLAETRKKEVTARHNFEMLKQSLEDELKFASEEMDQAKKDIAESTEKKATATGDVGMSSKELAEDVEAKGSLQQDCRSKAAAFRAETNSRGEELKALAEAQKIIEEATAGSALNQVSFVQMSRSMLTSGRDLHSNEAVHLVRALAKKHDSSALVQLASQMSLAMHAGGAFEKVRSLVSAMIAKLEKEAGADATKKAYCDKELAESNAKKGDKSDEVEKLSAKNDQLSAKSAQLKEEVAALESELGKLVTSQAEMDNLRRKEKDAFVGSKGELDKGLAGIKAALRVLREYYGGEGKAHGAAEGSASGILSLLEVVDADFSKDLAQITADEEAAVAEYDKVSKENEIEKTSKEQDVRYKLKESKGLDETSTELSSDRNGVQAELDAVQEYFSRIEDECVAKAETYQSHKERREAEIAGLKEALQVLESETALVQRRKARRTLRGVTLSAAA